MSDVFGNPLADRLADDLRAMVIEHDAAADRSQQTDLGPSEIGSPCTRCLARAVLGKRIERLDRDNWCANIGTAVHAWLADAAERSNLRHGMRWAQEMRVYPSTSLMPSGGSLDLWDARTNTVVDHKCVGEMQRRKIKAEGPKPAYRVQSHLYGLGLTNAGVRVDNVALAIWPRGGRLRDLYVWTEPYDEAVAMAALDRFQTIRDLALTHGEAILPQIPVDPDCFDCQGDVTLL
jgi:hypothetical protein